MKMNTNPVCPYTKKDCICKDIEYIDCKACNEFGNGVRATGDMPLLRWLLEKLHIYTKP